MALVIQCIVLCIIFASLILPPQFKDPVSQILSYPPAIRERVASLPQYKDRLQVTKRKNLARKIIGTLISVFILAALAYFSGKTTFGAAYIHVFILFLVVNMLDLLLFDFVIFAHSKKVIIPGTEDMTEEYKNPLHHIKGAFKGVIIGALAALLAASLVTLATSLL